MYIECVVFTLLITQPLLFARVNLQFGIQTDRFSTCILFRFAHNVNVHKFKYLYVKWIGVRYSTLVIMCTYALMSLICILKDYHIVNWLV